MTQTATRLPKFEGKPLIVIPEVIPVANYLEGDFGEAFLEEYNGRVKSEYNGNSNLQVLSFRDGIVKGSNPFAVVVANKVLSQAGIRTATPADLELALSANALNLRETYEDSAIVLRSTGKPNDYLAKDLVEQLQDRSRKLKTAFVLPLNGLDVVNDEQSPCGLAFRLTEAAQIIEAPILNGKEGYFNSEDVDKQTGLLQKLTQGGNRKLLVRNSGLSRLFLYWDLDLYSSDGDLADSGEDGRVVAVRGEAADADSLRTQYDIKKGELSARVAKAQEMLEAGYQNALNSLVKK